VKSVKHVLDGEWAVSQMVERVSCCYTWIDTRVCDPIDARTGVVFDMICVELAAAGRD
jgi:hypothetical protein